MPVSHLSDLSRAVHPHPCLDAYRLESSSASTYPDCIALAEQAGWNEVGSTRVSRRSDAAQVATKGSALDISVGVVARHLPTDRIVGCCLAWLFGATHAGIGFMLVDPQHRSTGLGRCAWKPGAATAEACSRLFRALIELAGPKRRFELISYPMGDRLYLSEGFKIAGPCLTLVGVVSSQPSSSSAVVRLARADELPQLWELDRRAGSGRDRHLLLAELAALGCVYVHEASAGAIDAFATHSQAGSILHVGPVISPDDTIAHALIGPALRVGVQVCVHTTRLRDDPVVRMLVGCGVAIRDDPAKRQIHMVRGHLPIDVAGARYYALAGATMG